MSKSKEDLRWNKKVLSKSNPLQNLLKSTLQEWYNAKHRFNSKEEVDFLNSVYPEICPFCHETIFVKAGKNKNGIQRYKCQKCFSYFTILTGTVFDSHKIPISEWIEFLIHIIEHHSLRTSSRDNQNSRSTGKYWIYKLFEVLSHIQDEVVLSGRIYFDETYVPLVKRVRANKNLKGLKQICIGVATDGKYTILINEKVNKETENTTYKLFKKRFKEGSTIVHDENHSHNILFRDNKLFSESYNSKKIKELPAKKNPLEKINHIHFLFKDFIRSHGGFSRDEIDGWINIFSFLINPPFNAYKKIGYLINLALNTHKILRYRALFCKKANKH